MQLEKKIINQALDIIQHVNVNSTDGPDPYWFWISGSKMETLIALRDRMNETIDMLKQYAEQDYDQHINQDAWMAEADSEMYE